MSKQYFKAEIEYDNNMGSSDKETLYILEDNTSDCMSVCTKDGRSVTLDGTDSYIEMLRHVLGLDMMNQIWQEYQRRQRQQEQYQPSQEQERGRNGGMYR